MGRWHFLLTLLIHSLIHFKFIFASTIRIHIGISSPEHPNGYEIEGTITELQDRVYSINKACPYYYYPPKPSELIRKLKEFKADVLKLMNDNCVIDKIIKVIENEYQKINHPNNESLGFHYKLALIYGDSGKRFNIRLGRQLVKLYQNLQRISLSIIPINIMVEETEEDSFMELLELMANAITKMVEQEPVLETLKTPLIILVNDTINDYKKMLKLSKRADLCREDFIKALKNYGNSIKGLGLRQGHDKDDLMETSTDTSDSSNNNKNPVRIKGLSEDEGEAEEEKVNVDYKSF